MKQKICFFAFFFLFAAIASAAILQGSAFEWFSLEKLNNTIIDVNSIPMQRIVAKNGDYSLELQEGDYLLRAEFFENNELKYVSEEKISIENDGTFNLDLIMFPPTENDLNELLNNDLETNIDFPNQDNNSPIQQAGKPKTDSFNLLTTITIIVLLLVIVLVASFRLELGRKNKTHETMALAETKATVPEIIPQPAQKQENEKLDKYAQEVLDALRKNGNRLTQKELRDKITSVGEAKISLIVSELEAAGKVKKIKKGRGNIIILKDGA